MNIKYIVKERIKGLYYDIQPGERLRVFDGVSTGMMFITEGNFLIHLNREQIEEKLVLDNGH